MLNKFRYNFMVNMHKMDYEIVAIDKTKFEPKDEYKISDFINYSPSVILFCLYFILKKFDKRIVQINKVVAKNEQKKNN